MKTPNIETERLFLKAFSNEEINKLFKTSSRSTIMKTLGHQSLKEYELEEYKYKNGYASYNRKFILFLLTLPDTQEIIGRCGLHNWNQDHQRAEIGYIIQQEKYKNQGFMGEAVYAVLYYGFNVMKLNRIEAQVGPTNTPSLRIMKKNNFTQEGVLRNHYFTEDGFEDSLMFSLLKEEYKT